MKLKIRHYIIIFLTTLTLCFSCIGNVSAQESQPISNEITFEAEVVRILDERQIEREDGSKATQQNLLLKGIKGEFENKQVEYNGISEIDVFSANVYKVGQKVIVQQNIDIDGNEVYYVLDYIRRGYIYFLAILFALAIVVIGGKKGFRSLISLIASFLIIMYFILPRILAGSNPLMIGVIGSFLILAVIIYITEGVKRKSHIAIIAVLGSLLVTFIISIVFTKLTSLTGMAQEESVFLIGITNSPIDFRGLLLAGILIGTVGVLDDVIVGQLETIKQLVAAKPNITKKELFKSAYKVGNTHLGAIVNTLFLTYTGVSLPLLLLFSINEPPFLTIREVINHELIATEIVRTLVGSIGVALSLPITTILGVYFLNKKNRS